MSQSEQQDHYEKQRRAQYHNGNLQGRAGDEKAETTQILTALSEIDDLPMDPEDDEVMGQLISKLTSTANLTEAEVRSNEWVREYILLMYLAQFPTPDGCHGPWRGWAHASAEQDVEPLHPRKRTEIETLVTSSKLALSRSEDAKVIEETNRNRQESYVHDAESDSGSGGILGRLRG